MSIQKMLPVIYWIVALSVSGFALVRGERDERIACAILLLGSMASVLIVYGAPVNQRVPLIQSGIFAIDIVTLGAFVLLAFSSKRFWPLWAAGFHLVAVATHAAHLVSNQIVPRAYVLAQGLWAYPMWFSILIGCMGVTRRRQIQQSPRRMGVARRSSYNSSEAVSPPRSR